MDPTTIRLGIAEFLSGHQWGYGMTLFREEPTRWEVHRREHGDGAPEAEIPVPKGWRSVTAWEPFACTDNFTAWRRGLVEAPPAPGGEE